MAISAYEAQPYARCLNCGTHGFRVTLERSGRCCSLPEMEYGSESFTSAEQELEERKNALRRAPIDLSFSELRTTNVSRCVTWHGDARPWTSDEWVTAFVGEVGEFCNVLKKLKRIEQGLPGNTGDQADALRAQLGDELADAQLYLDLLAWSLGVDLGAATRAKFNKTSEKHGFPQRL